MDIELGYVEYSKINSTGIQEYYNYWKQKCAGRQFPTSKDIDINALPKATPYIHFAEIHYLPLRIFYTVVGSKVVEYEESDFNNKWLREIKDWAPVDILGEMNCVKRLIRKRVPIFGAQETYWSEKINIAQWGDFPVSDDNKTITHFVFYNDYGNNI